MAFVSPPGAPVQDSVALRSLCTGPCRLTVQLLVSGSTGAPLLVLQTTWARPGSPRPRRTRLRLPPSLAFRRGFYNRHVVDARGGVLRAWVAGLNDSSESGSYAGAAVRATAVLKVTPPSQRPPRPPTGCPSWSAALLWSTAVTTHQCPQGAGRTTLTPPSLLSHCVTPSSTATVSPPHTVVGLTLRTSPQLRRTSPQLSRTSPQLRRTSPQLRRTSPQLRRTW